MHADYLSVTMSEDSALSALDELTPVLFGLGISGVYDGLYKLQNGGTFKCAPIGRGNSGYILGASGAFLDLLRAESLYSTYLHVLGSFPRRVTRLDVAHDVSGYSPPKLAAIHKSAQKGKYTLNGRKLNLQTGYNFMQSKNQKGDMSGTIYIGPKKPQKASLMIYDKKKQMFDLSLIHILTLPTKRIV